MNAWFAASLFDSPWVVVVIVVVSVLSNWLSKRREGKQAGSQPGSDEPSPSSSKPPGEFNLEETLRRLMGEEPPPPAPPPIPRTAQGETPPVPDWVDEELFSPEPTPQPAKNTAPVLPSPLALARVIVTPREADTPEEQAARRFEQLNERGRHPATVVSHTRQRPSRSGPRVASHWRDSRRVRRAFVASLVFAPPKSFEP